MKKPIQKSQKTNSASPSNNKVGTKKATEYSKPKRPPIPTKTQLRLWIEAGGRCEFKGCNEYLYYDQLTLSEANYSNIAHIVAWVKTGPRGNKIESPLLAKDISNLMLMCKKHAGEIDLQENLEVYNKFVLRQYKKEHEDRIKTLTSIHEETFKTKPLVFSVNIGDRLIPISTESVFHAIKPKFATKLVSDSLTINDFNHNAGLEYWQGYTNQIKNFVDNVKGKYSGGPLEKHISIFAIGPMPFLMYLGKCVGDVPGYDVYQSFRDAADEKNRWRWVEGINGNYETYVTIFSGKNQDSKSVALILEISDNIHSNHLDSVVQENWAVYKIRVNNPSVFYLKQKEQLINFAYEYRKLLDYIKFTHGPGCEINIFPALPVSIAVQCGLSLLPTKDPSIYIYELYKEEAVFKRVLKLQ